MWKTMNDDVAAWSSIVAQPLPLRLEFVPARNGSRM
jgi:hypothetical protein